jgi:hypothetical protein
MRDGLSHLRAYQMLDRVDSVPNCSNVREDRYVRWRQAAKTTLAFIFGDGSTIAHDFESIRFEPAGLLGEGKRERSEEFHAYRLAATQAEALLRTAREGVEHLLHEQQERQQQEERKAADLAAKAAPEGSGSPSPTVHISNLLLALPARLTDTAERGFIEEAITCIRAGAPRAAIVLGWCAVIDRMRRRIEAIGFDKFNAASTTLKNQTTGKYKQWNKGVQATSQAELLPIFDTDLMIVLEGMGLLDDNQHQRLKMLFQWRCHSAHPAATPINTAHVVSFFTDAVDLVLANKKFSV